MMFVAVTLLAWHGKGLSRLTYLPLLSQLSLKPKEENKRGLQTRSKH